MPLKRKTKTSAEFSMASMTDIIFLLLLYFMIISTVVQTNAIRVLLPQSARAQTERTIVRVTIDLENNFYIARDRGRDMPVTFYEIEPFLQQVVSDNPEMFVALHADEMVPYREIVRVLDVANRNNFRLVLATRPLN